MDKMRKILGGRPNKKGLKSLKTKSLGMNSPVSINSPYSINSLHSLSIEGPRTPTANSSNQEVNNYMQSNKISQKLTRHRRRKGRRDRRREERRSTRRRMRTGVFI